MPHFSIKRLPAGFGFPLNKRSIKAGLGEYLDLFRTIEISRISSDERSRSFGWYWVGILTATYDDGWYFDLRIEGVRDEHLQPYKEQIEATLIRDIRAFVAEKLALPETSTSEPRQLFLGYLISGNSIESKSFGRATNR